MVPLKLSNFLARLRFPKTQRPVFGPGCQKLSIPRKAHGKDGSGVTAQAPQLFTSGNLPQADSSVIGPGSEDRAVRGEVECHNRNTVKIPGAGVRDGGVVDPAHFLSGCRIPHTDGLFLTRGSHELAIARRGEAMHSAS